MTPVGVRGEEENVMLGPFGPFRAPVISLAFGALVPSRTTHHKQLPGRGWRQSRRHVHRDRCRRRAHSLALLVRA